MQPSLRIPSNPRYLRLVRMTVAEVGQLSGLSEDSIDEVMLGVDEACTNVIRHAYNNDFNGEIIIKFIDSDKIFEVIIEDHGKKADPDSFICKPLGEFRIGGYGLHLMRRAFKVLSYDQTTNDSNRLRMLRNKKEYENNNR